VAEQLRRQRGAAAPPDPLAGRDVLVSLRVDEHRDAAIYRNEWDVTGTARAPGGEEHHVAWCTDLGGDPHVAAGRLPPGAVAARVRDRSGAWHEPVAGGGYWLCVLPQRAGQREPPVEYRDAEGAWFALAVEAGDELPALWPAQATATPRLHSYGGREGGPIETHTYGGGDWEVAVSRHAGDDQGGRSLPGSILGHPHAFGVTVAGREWTAVAACGAFWVEVTGTGEPPPRLDLDNLNGV
jgi:hypothetical protein